MHAIYDTETELIRDLHDGSHKAFTAIYQQLHRRLYFFALRFVGENDAEDITAESFLELWKKKATLDSLNDISAYLHVLVRNRCFNHLRDQRLRHHKEAEILHLLKTQSAQDHLLEQIRIDLIDQIYAHIDRLPPRMQTIFLLSYRDGLKPAQIAEQLDLNVQTVSNQKLNAVKLLKTAMDSHSLKGILFLLLHFEQV